VIKSGLFSKEPDVAIICCRVFTKMVSLINENSQSGPMNEFRYSYQEWFTVDKNYKVPGAPKKNFELESFQGESGIKAFLRAYMRHPQEFLDTFALFLIQASESNQIETFTHHVRLNCANNLMYLNLMHDLSDVFFKTQSGKATFVESGVLNLLIDMTLQIAGNSTSFNGFSNSQILSERTASMVFLVDIWKF
jgi:hypothetical protein